MNRMFGFSAAQSVETECVAIAMQRQKNTAIDFGFILDVRQVQSGMQLQDDVFELAAAIFDLVSFRSGTSRGHRSVHH